MNGPAIGCSIVCMMPMTNVDEDALRAARPLSRGGLMNCGLPVIVVFVRKIRRGDKPNAGFQIEVDGRAMTVWELWARFRSELG